MTRAKSGFSLDAIHLGEMLSRSPRGGVRGEAEVAAAARARAIPAGRTTSAGPRVPPRQQVRRLGELGIDA